MFPPNSNRELSIDRVIKLSTIIPANTKEQTEETELLRKEIELAYEETMQMIEDPAQSQLLISVDPIVFYQRQMVVINLLDSKYADFLGESYQLETMGDELYSRLFENILPKLPLDKMLSVLKLKFQDRKNPFVCAQPFDVAMTAMLFVSPKIDAAKSDEEKEMAKSALWKLNILSFRPSSRADEDNSRRNIFRWYMDLGYGRHVPQYYVDQFAREERNIERIARMYNPHSANNMFPTMAYYAMYLNGKKRAVRNRLEIVLVLHILQQTISSVIDTDEYTCQPYGLNVDGDAVRYIIYLLEIIDAYFRANAVIPPHDEKEKESAKRAEASIRILERELQYYNLASLSQLMLPYLRRWEAMARGPVERNEE